MRSIGRLEDETLAKRLDDVLHGAGIESQVDRNLQGSWEVWVLDDENIERATRVFEQFHQHPDAPRFLEASRTAARQRQSEEQARAGKRTRIMDGRTLFYVPPVPVGVLTLVLIILSVGVTLLTDLGKNARFTRPFSITEYQVTGDYVRWAPGLPEIRHGQVWRLFTPMLLHFGILHILFNMLWLRDLGSMIEARKSPWLLLLLVLVLAGISNLGQYWWKGPSFGGMSGVVYGLLGYIWMQGRFNPASRLSLQPQTVISMIIWFLLCFTPLIPNVANTAHAVGFGVGIVWGYLAARAAVALRRG
jgi:GlpG protein